MKELLTTKGITLRPREYENFMDLAVDKTGQYVFYEEYVTKLIQENDRHRDYLVKDYDAFKPG